MYSLEDTWDLNHTFRASETNLMTLRSLTDDAPNMLRTSFRSFAFYRELDEQVLWRIKIWIAIFKSATRLKMHLAFLTYLSETPKKVRKFFFNGMLMLIFIPKFKVLKYLAPGGLMCSKTLLSTLSYKPSYCLAHKYTSRGGAYKTPPPKKKLLYSLESYPKYPNFIQQVIRRLTFLQT